MHARVRKQECVRAWWKCVVFGVSLDWDRPCCARLGSMAARQWGRNEGRTKTPVIFEDRSSSWVIDSFNCEVGFERQGNSWIARVKSGDRIDNPEEVCRDVGWCWMGWRSSTRICRTLEVYTVYSILKSWNFKLETEFYLLYRHHIQTRPPQDLPGPRNAPAVCIEATLDLELLFSPFHLDSTMYFE